MRFSAKAIAKFLVKEWYIAVGIVAVLSLALLIFYLPTSSRKETLAQEKLEKIEVLVKSGHLDQAGAALGDFLQVHAAAPVAWRAYLMRAEIHVARGERGETVDIARNEAISANLRQAREKGADPARVNAVEWRAAEMLAKKGLIPHAMDRYRTLTGEKEYVSAHLELARLQAGIGPAAADEDLVWEKEEVRPIPSGGEKPYPVRAALQVIDDYLLAAPPTDRAMGHVVAAEILAEFRCDDDAMKAFAEAMGSAASPAARLRALVGRGKFMLRIGRIPEAIRDLTEAKTNDDIVREEGILDLTDYFLAEARRVAKDRGCIDLNQRLIITGSPLTPVAEISLARFYAASGEMDPADYFISGIAHVASRDLFRSAGLDVPEMYRDMSRAWEREGDGDPLPYLKALEVLSRLYPREGKFLEGQGRIYQRLADDGRRRAQAMRERDPAGAEREEAASDGHYLRAAMKFELITKERTRSTDEIIDAHRRAAELFRMGKFFAKSAEHYGAVAVLLPLEKRRMHFLQAQTLRDGGILTTDDAGQPGALEVYDQCIDWVSPAEDVSRKALIGRGEILMDLGRYEQAASVFRLFIDDRAGRFGLTPDAEEWKQALYLDGLCRLNAALARGGSGKEAEALMGEARKSLSMFLDRYAAPTPHRLCMAASYDLGRCFAEEKDYARALECYRRAVRWGLAREKEMTSKDLETLKRASFSTADTLFILDRFAESAEEYDDALRRYAASKDRLWALIGLARCEARLGKKNEAMDHLEGARNLLRDFRTAFEDSPKGYGVDFWDSVIRDVETMVREI